METSLEPWLAITKSGMPSLLTSATVMPTGLSPAKKLKRLLGSLPKPPLAFLSPRKTRTSLLPLLATIRSGGLPIDRSRSASTTAPGPRTGWALCELARCSAVTYDAGLHVMDRCPGWRRRIRPGRSGLTTASGTPRSTRS